MAGDDHRSPCPDPLPAGAVARRELLEDVRTTIGAGPFAAEWASLRN